MINKGLFTSNTDQWSIPQVFFEKLMERSVKIYDMLSNEEQKASTPTSINPKI
jgi:hypothetical protein